MYWISRLNRDAGRMNIGGTGVEVFHWAYNAHLQDNVPHRHTYFEVCLVGRYGKGVFTVESVPHEIAPGDLFIARPGVVHQIQNSGPELMELMWVSFSWPAPEGRSKSTESSAEAATLFHAFATSESLVIPGEKMRVLWDALRTIAEGPEIPGKEFQLQALSASLLLAIAQAGSGDRLPVSEPLPANLELPAKLAVRYIQDNLSRRLSVEEVATHVALSPRHFGRIFQKFTGVTPAEYIETARLHRARHLLRHSHYSVKEIATLVGYADAHHFSRVFSRRYGISPLQWRQGHEPAPRGVQLSGELV